MGRGATTDDSLDILYGDMQPRRQALAPGFVQIGDAVDLDRVVSRFDVLADTIEYFDQNDQLCMVEVTGPGGYTVTNFSEMRRLLIGQHEPLLEDVTFDTVGTKLYLNGGRLSRKSGPAFEGPDGSWAWYHRGYEHREPDASGSVLPASRAPDGTLGWYRYGLRHREDGPAIEYADGARFYYRYGRLHREDGPAMISADTSDNWYLYGNRHRDDGPAATTVSGEEQYYLYGQQCDDIKDLKKQKRHHDHRKEAERWKSYCEEQQHRTWKQRLLQGLYEIS